MNNNNITKIVLTGGSCAGKTECLNPLKEHFSQRGYSVYIVNEMATELILGGINPGKIGGKTISRYYCKNAIRIRKCIY